MTIIEKLNKIENIKQQLSSIIFEYQDDNIFDSDKKYSFEDYPTLFSSILKYYRNEPYIDGETYINNKIEEISQGDETHAFILSNPQIKKLKSLSLKRINDFDQGDQLSTLNSIDAINCEYIGNKVFVHDVKLMGGLKEINLPSLLSVGDEAFKGNQELTYVNLSSLTSFNSSNVFYYFGNKNTKYVNGMDFSKLTKCGKHTFANFKASELNLSSLTSSIDSPFQIVDTIKLLNVSNIDGFWGNFITQINYNVTNGSNRLSIDLSNRDDNMSLLPKISAPQQTAFTNIRSDGSIAGSKLYNMENNNTILSQPKYMFILRDQQILNNTLNAITNDNMLSCWQYLKDLNDTLDDNWKIFHFN